MAKILTDIDMGARPTPSPALGIAGYRGEIPNAEAPGQALAQLGTEVAREFAIYQEKADTVRVEDAWNEYKRAALEVTNGEKGVLKTRAGNAVNGNILQTTEQQLGAARKRILEGLASDEQRKRFEVRAAATDLQVREQTLRHLEVESREYAKTVIMGSEAAAKAQITAAPTSQDVFNGARDTLFRQADAYLEAQGVTDAAAKDQYKAKINDALWTARIDALLYAQPVLAEAMFRANQAEIKDPVVRLTLQNKTREVALGVDTDNSAERIIQEFREKNPPVTQTPVTNVSETARILELKDKPNWTAKERAEITAYFKRVRPQGGTITEDEIATLPAAMTSVDPMAQNTSGLPQARDIAAQLPLMQTRVEKMANEKFGPDAGNPDRAAWIRRTTQALHAKVSAEVQALNAIQRQVQGELIDAIIAETGTPTVVGPGGTTSAGGGAQRARIASFAQIQSNPELLRRWQQVDPAAKPALLNLMAKNIEVQKDGDPAKYRELYDRINLPVGDPRKINFVSQIIDPAVAKDLSIAQIEHLQRTLRQAETDGGRGWMQSRKFADSQAQSFFKSYMLFAADPLNGPAKSQAAFMRWTEDVAKKIDEYASSNPPRDPAGLFTLGAKDSMVGPEQWQKYTTSVPGTNRLSADAQAVADGTKAPIAGPPPAAVASPAAGTKLNTPEEVRAWIDTLPATVTHINIPGRGIAPIPGRAADQGATRPDGTPKGTGFLGPLKVPGTNSTATEYSVGVTIAGKHMDIPTLVPTLTKAEVDQVLAAAAKNEFPPPAVMQKAIAFAEKRVKEGKPVFAEPSESPPPARMNEQGKIVPPAPQAMPKGALPEFGGSINEMTPEYAAKHVTEINLEAVKHAAKETGKAVLWALNPLTAGRQMLDLYYAGVETLKTLPPAARRESARAYFDDILKKEKFFKEDVPALREALKYGDLSVADRKKAKAMLKAAGEKE